MRVVLFSLDAILAFVIVIVALQSLMFILVQPSSYIPAYIHAHYVLEDVVNYLVFTKGEDVGVGGKYAQNPLLYYLTETDSENVENYLGKLCTPFYIHITYKDEDGTQHMLYDCGDGTVKRLKLVKHVPVLIMLNEENADDPYTYHTCNGGTTLCSEHQDDYKPQRFIKYDVIVEVYR